MIKLVYEKLVDGVRHLFGSTTGIPADGDTQVTYVSTSGAVDITDGKLFYEKDGQLAKSTDVIPTASDVQFNAICGEEVIVGKSVTITVTNTTTHGTVVVSEKVAEGATVTVTVHGDETHYLKTKPTVTANGESVTMSTASNDTSTGTFTASADIALAVSGGAFSERT